MITEAKFKYALKEMMEQSPLEEINVTALCKKCGCHRQTFYYHYTDIYDLIAAILFNEKLPSLDSAKSEEEAVDAFVDFVHKNFDFLKLTYNSAARDLVEDFFFEKLNGKFLTMWMKKADMGLSKNGIRDLSRRFSRFLSSEFIQSFKDMKLTGTKFASKMSAFVPSAISVVLPSFMALSVGEGKK